MRRESTSSVPTTIRDRRQFVYRRALSRHKLCRDPQANLLQSVDETAPLCFAMSGKHFRSSAPLGGNVSRRASRRWTLRSISVFKHYMEFPGRGKPFSVRSLAKESGVGEGVIEKLLTGRQSTADVDDATALTEAVGSAIFPLFAPPSSPDPNRTSLAPTPTSEE